MGRLEVRAQRKIYSKTLRTVTHFGKMSINYRDISEFDLTKMLKM